METSREKAKQLCTWGMKLYYAEILYSLYLDRSLMLFLMRLLFAKGLADFAVTGNPTPNVNTAGIGGTTGPFLNVRTTTTTRRSPAPMHNGQAQESHPMQSIKTRVMGSFMLAMIGFLFHFPYDGSPLLFQRELFVDLLGHTKFLTFTAAIDRYSGLQLFVIDFGLCLLRIFMLSLSMVAAGTSDPIVVSMGHKPDPEMAAGLHPKSPTSQQDGSPILTSIVSSNGLETNTVSEGSLGHDRGAESGDGATRRRNP